MQSTMAPDRREFTTALEHRLRKGLAALARTVEEVGAQSVSVILLEMDGSSRVVYHWPEAAGNSAMQLPPTDAVLALLRGLQRPVMADFVVTRFLNGFVTPANRSFLLLPWPERSIQVIIAFGFATGRTPVELDVTSPMLDLAALATGIVSEIRQLRRDLFVVNERLGNRKTVERAKGILQARNGWSEQQAYEHLRKLSRQRRRTLSDTAEEILRASNRLYSGPQP